ncbi:MAG: acyl-ACP--UDP-N-acetylglucosamine O-acyltransferase [Bacteroidales bacterium]|nr:acyl-ACP--UDP-N-acetylglucosamine O-acyltransferase [Bacteroidales bacterium]MBN2817720.1 acyl-ACP--UDP-N-acetylglucosamine O-acyltransferase [Bacteroidales bacterium]
MNIAYMNQTLTNIHPEAIIGENVVIESFTTISKDVVIGDNTWIGPNVVIMDGARIGKNCKIFPGAVIAGIPQDLKFVGEETTVEIGDNNIIREYVTINRGTKAKGKTVIGNNCLIQSYAHVAHDCLIGNNVIVGSYSGLAGEVEVDEFAIVSPGTLVHQFVKIGKHVIIQGGSKVIKDVPPFITAGREPLVFAGLNSVGLRRRGFSTEKIDEIQSLYRQIYQMGMNVSTAIKYIEENHPETEVRDEIISFIKDAKRGIIRGMREVS